MPLSAREAVVHSAEIRIPEPPSGSGQNRRRHRRTVGPFDGCRVGLIETPLRIFDLSRGGCFINSMHEQTLGARFAMTIVLPDFGPLALHAETLYVRGGFGFAVRFFDVDADTQHRLNTALDRLRGETPRVERQATFSPPVVQPLAESTMESPANRFFRDNNPRRGASSKFEDRPRSPRIGMLGSGYRALVDGRQVAIINLSLSGAQVRGPLRLLPDQPVVLKLGWPQDHLSFTAIARAKWVQFEPDSQENVSIYRTGLVFETWDVRRLKEIMRNRGRSSAPTIELLGTW